MTASMCACRWLWAGAADSGRVHAGAQYAHGNGGNCFGLGGGGGLAQGQARIGPGQVGCTAL